MASVGAVLGGVITVAGWIAGNVPAAFSVLGVVFCLTAAAGLLAYAVAALPQHRDVILAAVPVALLAIIGSVAAKDPETRMSSAPSSTLAVTRSGRGGLLSFSGLVPQPDPGQPAGEPIDLAGTLAWECAAVEAAP